MSLTPEHKPAFPRRWQRKHVDPDRRHSERRHWDRLSRFIDRGWLLLVTCLWVWAFVSLSHQQDRTQDLSAKTASATKALIAQQRIQDEDRAEGTKQRCEIVLLNLKTLELAHANKLVVPYTVSYTKCKALLGKLDPKKLKELEAEERVG